MVSCGIIQGEIIDDFCLVEELGTFRLRALHLHSILMLGARMDGQKHLPERP